MFGIIGETRNLYYIIVREEELIISNTNLKKDKIKNVIKQLKTGDINAVPKDIKRIIKKKYAFPITLDIVTTVYLFSNNKDLYEIGNLIEHIFFTLYQIQSEINYFSYIFKKIQNRQNRKFLKKD